MTRGRQPRLLIALCVCLALAAPAAWAKRYSEKQEKRVGDEVMKDIKAAKLIIEAPEQLARVKHITDELAKFSTRPDVEYQVYILKWDEPNAISIPGGHICVTKGLLSDAQSDDELAGVLAHEMAHNTCYHAMKQLDRGRKSLKYGLIAVLLGLIAGGAEGAVTVAQAATWTSQAILSEYSIEMEAEADREGINILYQSPYNPVGLLTFMERLTRGTHRNVARDVRVVDPGVFQTHPELAWRAHQIISQLHGLNVDINRREVTYWAPARATRGFVAGVPGGEVDFLGRVVYAPVGTDGSGGDGLARAEHAAERLNDAVGRGLQSWDFRSERGEDGEARVYGAREMLFTITHADAEAHGVSAEELAARAVKNIKAGLIKLSTEARY
ncbi:MAG: M48 family metalloprotease [Armatimonadota bacterium]